MRESLLKCMTMVNVRPSDELDFLFRELPGKLRYIPEFDLFALKLEIILSYTHVSVPSGFLVTMLGEPSAFTTSLELIPLRIYP